MGLERLVKKSLKSLSRISLIEWERQRAMGKAAIVLEPAQLREDILNELDGMLAEYRKSKSSLHNQLETKRESKPMLIEDRSDKR
jgi:hypothetical protein